MGCEEGEEGTIAARSRPRKKHLMSKPALTCGKCDEGGSASGTLICRGRTRSVCPGVPCDMPTCPYRIDRRPVNKRTGLGCIRCRQPVATIEDEGAGTVIFQCPTVRLSDDYERPLKKRGRPDGPRSHVTRANRLSPRRRNGVCNAPLCTMRAGTARARQHRRRPIRR